LSRSFVLEGAVTVLVLNVDHPSDTVVAPSTPCHQRVREYFEYCGGVDDEEDYLWVSSSDSDVFFLTQL
jgi:hypothetical protein